MKTLQKLMRQVKKIGSINELSQRLRWREQGDLEYLTHASRKPGSPHPPMGQSLRNLFTSPETKQPSATAAHRPKASAPALDQVTKTLIDQKRFAIPRKAGPSVMVAIAVVSLTSTLGYRFYDEPKLDVGKEAPQTIKAPSSVNIEDTKSTEEKRKAARTGSVPVLTLNQQVNQQIYQDLERWLQQGNELRELAGPFPFTETSILSAETQLYLRKAQIWEWRAVLEAAKNVDKTSLPRSTFDFNRPWQASSSSEASEQSLAILELQTYYRNASRRNFETLVATISRSRQQYPQAVNTLNQEDFANLRTLYTLALFDFADADWQEMQVGVRQAAERILAQGYPPGLAQPILREAVRMQIKASAVPADTEALATKLLIKVLKPNLIKDPEQTKLQAEQAALAVEPLMVSIRQGEVIVQGGDSITQSQFVLLDHFNLSRRGFNWAGWVGFGGLISGAVAIFWVVEERFHPRLRRQDHILVLLLTLSTPLLLILGVSSPNLPALGLLIGSFYGSALGMTVVGLLSVALPIGMEISGSHLLASTLGGLLGGVIAGRLRSREELALLGGAVGLTQAGAFLIVELVLNATTGAGWYALLVAPALHGLAGLAWSIVALGISPYLEHLFDLVTPIRLAELANPNRPLLKRLASETPGTFQHTLFVATLAEAAARALGCNVELVRTGTLYHDIGKMHDPLGFIENQMGGPNKHDEINDPWKSAELIKKHVSEGLVMARKCRLPKAIQAFIPEHQGTMLIAYFYYQAQQRAEADPSIVVQESDFRYDGPIPQSRETGIVMLADSCEAALRSLKDATPEEALAMINKILRARWQDNQLVDSGISRSEMSQIAEIFVQVWQQFNHQRIPYPKAALPAK